CCSTWSKVTGAPSGTRAGSMSTSMTSSDASSAGADPARWPELARTPPPPTNAAAPPPSSSRPKNSSMSSARSSPVSTREFTERVEAPTLRTAPTRPANVRCTPASVCVYDPSAAMRPVCKATSDCRTAAEVARNVAQPSPNESASSPRQLTSTVRLTCESTAERFASKVATTVPNSDATSLSDEARTRNVTIRHPSPAARRECAARDDVVWSAVERRGDRVLAVLVGERRLVEQVADALERLLELDARLVPLRVQLVEALRCG